VPRKQQRADAGSGLSKQRVVAEAIRLADAEGVDGLSMRRLATVLDAGAMSLYYYVANKDELLDAMVDVVFGEIALPPGDADWQTAMRQRSRSARRTRTGCSTATCTGSRCRSRACRSTARRTALSWEKAAAFLY